MGEKRQFVHPYINFLVEAISRIHEAFVEHRYIDCCENMYSLIANLEPEIREQLKNEEELLERMLRNPKMVTLDKLRQVQVKISTLLHQAGYFEQAKMTPREGDF